MRVLIHLRDPVPGLLIWTEIGWPSIFNANTEWFNEIWNVKQSRNCACGFVIILNGKTDWHFPVYACIVYSRGFQRSSRSNLTVTDLKFRGVASKNKFICMDGIRREFYIHGYLQLLSYKWLAERKEIWPRENTINMTATYIRYIANTD